MSDSRFTTEVRITVIMGLKTQTKTYNTFSTGIVTDTPHTEIPDTACAYATNAIFYKDGNVANRGGVYRKWASSITGPRGNGSYVSIGSYKTKPTGNSSDMLCALSYRAGRSNGTRIVFEPWDAAVTAGTYSTVTNQDSLSSTVETSATGPVIGLVPGLSCGKTFDYFGDMGVAIGGPAIGGVDPLSQQGQNGMAFFAGNPGGTQYSHYISAQATPTAVVAAGNNAITFGSAPTWASVLPGDPVGKYIYVTDGTSEYIGKIIKVTSTTIFNVSPTPTKSFTVASVLAANAMVRISNIANVSGWNVETGGGAIPAIAASGCVHQNRVVLAGAEPVPYATADLVAVARTDVGSMFYTNMRTQNGTVTTIKPINTICWSSIRAEPATAVNGNVDGDLPLLRGGWPKSQYVTLDTKGITAIVPIDVNNLLVLCVDKVLMLSGTLGTILPNANLNNSDFNIRTLSTTYSCINDATVQVTKYGIFFSDKNGIYLTDGYKFVDILKNKISNAFVGLNNSSTYSSARLGDAEPTGSAFVKGHYILFYPTVDNNLNSLASVCVNAELDFAVSYFTFQIESGLGAAYPVLGYTTTVSTTGSIVVVMKNTMTNAYDCILNVDGLCTSTGKVFDCWSYLTNFVTLIIPKSVVLSGTGGLSRLKEVIFNYQTYVTAGSQASSTSASRQFLIQKGIIDNVSFAIASVTVAAVTPSETTSSVYPAASVYDTILERVNLVSGSLPDSTSTSTNSNIGYSYYPYFITSGTVFILNAVTYVFNSLKTGRMNR